MTRYNLTENQTNETRQSSKRMFQIKTCFGLPFGSHVLYLLLFDCICRLGLPRLHVCCLLHCTMVTMEQTISVYTKNGSEWKRIEKDGKGWKRMDNDGT